MPPYLFVAPVILSFIILITPDRIRWHYVLALNLFILLVTSVPSAVQLFQPGTTVFPVGGPLGILTCRIDGLSAFFVLVTNFTFLTGCIYSRGYLDMYRGSKRGAQLALHYFSYTWLHLSMLGVLMFRDGLAFLVAWELMAVSSFMLILFEAEKRSTLKTAVNYLIQMHVGLMFLVIAFLVCEADSGVFGFDGLPAYFSRHGNLGLFLLFFAGFAFKAGFVPLHTWLPEAHPAAPTHVSGVMSGVMIKMGIYGILRVLWDVRADHLAIGWILLGISAVSGLLGVMMAIVQHDLKKLLAYHSIENIGIIGMGVGLGAIGLGLGHPVLAILGFTGALLHVLNHSLFKSLLFYATGSVYKKAHTRNIEELGGVIHKMPHTSFLFLAGAVAICGIPPLNGFISEFIIYSGLITGLSAANAYQSVTMLLTIISLVMIGGLAVFCFTKVFGIVFLGQPRNPSHEPHEEAEASMLIPQYLIAVLLLFIGLFPMIFIRPLTALVAGQFSLDPVTAVTPLPGIFTKISVMAVILLSLTAALWLLRRFILRKRVTATGPTWGCGYEAGSPRQQYTGTSWANNFAELAQPVLQSKDEYEPIREDEIFPKERTFRRHPGDVFRSGTDRFTWFLMLALKKLARLQTGNIRHYVLYAFIFILIIFILMFLNIL